MTLPSRLHCLPLPTPFPVGPVNVFLAEGDPLTLIDTGPKEASTLQALEAGLRGLGHAVEEVRRIILTHHHVDHTGLAAEIARRSGALIFSHPSNGPWLRDYCAYRQSQRPFFHQLWEESGVPDDIVQAMDRATDGVARWLDPLPEVAPLEEGDCLRLAGMDWQVFHTPGHAGGQICLWQADSRLLLASDHLIRDISSNPVLEPPQRPGAPRPRRLVEYVEQLRRVAALRPAMALPGHGEPVLDVPGLVRQRLAFHRRRAQKVWAALADDSLNLWELTRPLFPRLAHGMDFFLALSEVLGHLDLLEVRALAGSTRQDGGVRWARLSADWPDTLYSEG